MVAEVMSKEEWRRRYAACLVAEGGMEPQEAAKSAEAGIEMAEEWLTPEDCAREEMSYWADSVG